MPTYLYKCSFCNHRFDVVKTVASRDDEESCEKCNKIAERKLCHFAISGASEYKAHFNPAFGKVCKSKRQEKEILAEFRDKGEPLIEVGDEPVEKLHKRFDTQREEAREKRWSESAEQIISEVL